MSHPVAWSKRWRKPVLISEWGAWAPPCRSEEDFKTYLRFVVDECKKCNIGWMYYSFGYNNQWAFNIFHTEDGWNQNALDILTGVRRLRPRRCRRSSIRNSRGQPKTGAAKERRRYPWRGVPV